MFKTASPIKETENLEGFFVNNFLHYVDVFYIRMKNMGFFLSCQMHNEVIQIPNPKAGSHANWGFTRRNYQSTQELLKTYNVRGP